MYTVIQVAGENVNGECMFTIKKNGNFTGTYIAAQTRGEAVQRYKKFLEQLPPWYKVRIFTQ